MVIDSVKLFAPTPGLKVTGVYGVDKGGRETFSRVDPQTTFGSRLHPIKGYTVPGPVDGQYTIAIGLTTARVGAYTVSAVDVSYHVGNNSVCVAGAGTLDGMREAVGGFRDEILPGTIRG